MAKKQSKDKITLEMAWEEIRRLQVQHNATQRRIDLQVRQCADLVQQVVTLEEKIYSLEHPQQGQPAQFEEIDPEVFAVRPEYMTDQPFQPPREEIVEAVIGEHVAWVDTDLPTSFSGAEDSGSGSKRADPELEALLDEEEEIARSAGRGTLKWGEPWTRLGQV